VAYGHNHICQHEQQILHVESTRVISCITYRAGSKPGDRGSAPYAGTKLPLGLRARYGRCPTLNFGEYIEMHMILMNNLSGHASN
jgi:hypothetical protein